MVMHSVLVNLRDIPSMIAILKDLVLVDNFWSRVHDEAREKVDWDN